MLIRGVTLHSPEPKPVSCVLPGELVQIIDSPSISAQHDDKLQHRFTAISRLIDFIYSNPIALGDRAP